MIQVQIMSGLACDGRPAVCEAVTTESRGGEASSLATLRDARDARRAGVTWPDVLLALTRRQRTI